MFLNEFFLLKINNLVALFTILTKKLMELGIFISLTFLLSVIIPLYISFIGFLFNANLTFLFLFVFILFSNSKLYSFFKLKSTLLLNLKNLKPILLSKFADLLFMDSVNEKIRRKTGLYTVTNAFLDQKFDKKASKLN